MLANNGGSTTFDVIVPDDDNDIPLGPPEYLLVAQDGVLVCDSALAVNITIPVQSGHVLLSPKRIRTASTVGSIVGCWEDR